MDGFTVQVTALDEAGTAATGVAAGVRGAGLADAAAGIGTALPGDATQSMGAQLTTAWTNTVEACASRLDRHAAGLTGAAAAYRRVDELNAAALAG